MTAVAIALVSGHVARPAAAQWAQFVAAPAAAAWTPNSKAGEEKPVSSFNLPTQTNNVKDAIQDFQRFVEHEAWEKAFKSLETIASKATDGFVERPDRVLVPSRLMVRSLLASMPPAGKSAYRVFYDAEATALWEKATGAAELDSLAQIVDSHLVSTMGDRAADRLGDLYFERGELHRAVSAWRTVLTYCPDSKIPKAQLLIKVATALTFARRTTDLDDVRRAIDQRYADETVVIGGQRVKAGEEVARLVESVQSAPAVAETDLPGDFELPKSDEVLWQFRFQTKPDPNNLANAAQPFRVMNIYGQVRANDFRIPAATDGKRVYLNTFGVEMAFDVATGKMLWRTGRMHELTFQRTRRGASPERYSIMVAGGRTWSVTGDANQNNRQSAKFSLVSRDAATGKELFSSRRSLSTWNIVGVPYLARDPGGIREPSTERAANAGHVDVPSGKPALDYSKGFSAGPEQLSLNGNAATVDSRIRLTDGGSKQASSVFTKTPLNVTGFETQFEFQFTKPFADGILFVLQGEGPTAIGGWNNGRNGISFEGISKSVGVKFDIYGPDANSTGLCLDGIRPTADGAISFKGSKIDLKSGHVFKVNMKYDGEDLRVTISDTKTQASHTASYSVDIVSHVGGSRAHVGFTGSSGLLTAVQDVLNWTYTPIAPRKKAPQPSGEVIYVGASRTNKSAELSVLMIDALTGKLKKNVTLGTHAVDPNQIYNDRPSEPSFVVVRDRLYVDTHAGAVVTVRPETATVEWGIQYESPPPHSGNNFYGYQPPSFGVSGPMAARGLLFAKGMRSPRIVALEMGGPALVWRRPVDVAAILVGADDKHLYTGGKALAAYDLETQEMVWSTQLPKSAAWSAPVLTESRLYQFTSRGIYAVDKRDGRVVGLFRGADLDAMGGSLFVTPTALITVSNVAITAYSLKDPTSTSGTDREVLSSKP